MSRSVEILLVDREALRRSYPDLTDNDRAAACLERARIVVDQPYEERVPDGLPIDERIARLRTALAQKAASVAVHRFELVATRDRLDRAKGVERATYERHLVLHKDIVPPLKLEAKALRAEVRRLEHRARTRGIDVEAIEPAIDWTNTIWVEDYEPPRYESNEDRRKATVEFFRRVGER